MLIKTSTHHFLNITINGDSWSLHLLLETENEMPVFGATHLLIFFENGFDFTRPLILKFE